MCLSFFDVPVAASGIRQASERKGKAVPVQLLRGSAGGTCECCGPGTGAYASAESMGSAGSVLRYLYLVPESEMEGDIQRGEPCDAPPPDHGNLRYQAVRQSGLEVDFGPAEKEWGKALDGGEAAFSGVSASGGSGGVWDDLFLIWGIQASKLCVQ